MEYKKGDKLVCIKEYAQFIPNKQYEIYCVIENQLSFFILNKNNNGRGCWFQINSQSFDTYNRTFFSVWEYFCDFKEYRKLKLEKLKYGI